MPYCQKTLAQSKRRQAGLSRRALQGFVLKGVIFGLLCGNLHAAFDWVASTTLSTKRRPVL